MNIKNSVSVVRVNVLLATDIACNDGKECVERKSGVSDAGMYISCLSPCRYPLQLLCQKLNKVLRTQRNGVGRAFN